MAQGAPGAPSAPGAPGAPQLCSMHVSVLRRWGSAQQDASACDGAVIHRSVEYDLNIFTVGGRVTDVCRGP